MAGPSRPSARVRIAFDREALVRFCLQRAIRRLGFFGSVLRDDFDDRSDVDILVEFLPGHTPGLAFFEMEEELSRLLGRRVDLNTPAFLSPHFRDDALRGAEIVYEQA